MTFLLDHDAPDDLVYSVQQLGHQVVRLREALPIKSSDAEVLRHAYSKRWIVITCNRDDFLDLAGKEPYSGIIVLIRRKTRVAERAALVRLLDNAGESGIVNNVNFA